MQSLMDVLNAINGILWHDVVLYTLVGVGVLFTLWSGFGQYRALTHGVAVIRGKYDKKGDPGAINHFQALSAALSATVGLGNIAGVALAVSTGGPGAVFWLWVTGFIGMALKATEVTQAMLYRDVSDPEDPHGGAMYVVKKGLAEISPALARFGWLIGAIFCVTLLISTITGGNMFQAWNVTDITKEYFGVPPLVTGIVMTVLVGMVIIGGIKRIGSVAGKLVPFMCLTYLVGGMLVLVLRAGEIPGMLRVIVSSAFNPSEAVGAFAGGAFGWVFLRGMQRALFSNEAGQGSAPIAHSAARTDEPVREGVVAGLEPFVDTLVVCTITALVILLSGVWKRGPEAPFTAADPAPVASEARPGEWRFAATPPPARTDGATWKDGDSAFLIVEADHEELRQSSKHKLSGSVVDRDGRLVLDWSAIESRTQPRPAMAGVYHDYKGATLTAKAFDSVLSKLGLILVPLTVWLFAVSTMISWSYYGEQGSIYLFGLKSVMPYRYLYCLAILIAGCGLIRTEADIDTISTLGTGVMLFANIPIMLLFGKKAMSSWHDYMRRLKAGEFDGGKG